MGTQGTGRKRSTKKERSTAEDDALNLIAREAEARLAAKRAARAEAREIRMKELERQQKEIFQVQKKYYGLNTKFDDRADNKWGDIEQWMEDSERYSRSSQIHMLSDEDERMSVGSRGSVRSDLDAVGAYGGGGSSHKKSKKKKKHKHKDKDRNGYDDDYSVISSRSSRLSDDSRVSRSSRLDLTSSRLSDDSRVSRASRLDLQPSAYASSDLYSLNGLSSSRNPGSTLNGYQSSLYEDSLCSGPRRVTGSSCHPLEYSSYRSSSSRASSRASSARASPVDNCGSVASFLRSAASSSGLPRDLDDVTIPDFSDVSRFALAGGRGCEVEDRDYLEKGSRAASALTAATLTSLGGTSSRRGSGETAITADTETSIREIKDALTEVEEKYRKAMVSNAQLDNEKNNLMYQVDTLKDSLMELEELLSESRREYEEKVKEFEREKHAHSVLQFQFNEMKEMLKQSEELLNEIRQLRMKQDGFVREISDLQETVEWKDKKIGALERQKEYTDAIRTERDELREEVVKLKDILKKHGIVLGPDLNINGDIVDAEVDGSPGGDSARQPAQDSQTPPTEGNSMLGNTEESQLRSSGEEEVDPEQHQEMLKEEAKENQLSSDSLCNVADVSTLERSSEEQPAEEQETCLHTEEDTVGESDFSKDLNEDSNDCPITEAKDIIVCSPAPQEVVTSTKDNVQETEMPEGGDSGETSNPEETETQSSDDFRETCNKEQEEQENKQEDAEESNLRNEESYPQQEVVEDIMKENPPHETVSAVSNTEPQQELENTEEAENDEAEEISSKSQSTAASGKKKKKKRRGKKKGGSQQKDGTEKEKSKTEQDLESVKKDNGSKTEPNIDDSVSESQKELKMDQVKTEQDRDKTEEVDAAKAVEPTETFSHQDAFKEPRMDHVTNEQDKEQTLETETGEEIKAVAPTETLSHTETPKEISVDHVTTQQNKEENLENEVEAVEAPTETFSHIETLKDLSPEPTKDEQDQEQTLETEKLEKVDSITSPPEASLSTSDLVDNSNSTESTDGLDKECTYSVDDALSGDIATNGEGIYSESEIVDRVEDEVGSVDEMKPECTADNPENSLETNSDENTDVPNNDNVTADETESTNSSEREGLTSVSPPNAGDFTDGLKSLSDSEPPSEPSVARNSLSDEVSDKAPEEETESVKEQEKPGVQTEHDCFSPCVIPPPHDGGDSELKQDGPQKEEPNRDSKEPEDLVEPDSSSRDERSESCDSASLMKNTDALDTEESLLETVAHVEPLDHVESQMLECVEQTDESNAKVSLGPEEINTTDVLNTPDSPKDASEVGSSVEQNHSTEDSAVAEDPDHKLDQESETSVCPSAEQLPESSKDESVQDSSQPTQQDSDEDDGEDDEGQSFDFDELDIDAAVETNPQKDQEEEEAEEGVEVNADESNNVSSELCQSNTETDENTQTKPSDGNDDEGIQVDTLDKESGAVPQDNQDSLAPEEATADGARHLTEEEKVLSAEELGVIAENQATSLPVEEGLDAIKHELQGDSLVLSKSVDQVADNKEPPQSGKDVKKNGKKGKGKGKEECKMS
ncbi:dentin sialophosphoprotein isoform X4 [Trachinotus anak]|uniref:dentin sialophosphoprotein isoform X4 n=1 Tax=Trachinotus anak TaxID=443729 RepID=UPI0039F1D842